MRLYCVSQIFEKGTDYIFRSTESAGDIQSRNMQSVTLTMMSLHTAVRSLKPICGEKDRETEA